MPVVLVKSPSSTYFMAVAWASWLFQAALQAATHCLMAAESASGEDICVHAAVDANKTSNAVREIFVQFEIIVPPDFKWRGLIACGILFGQDRSRRNKIPQAASLRHKN